jgi:hypothetical protein
MPEALLSDRRTRARGVEALASPPGGRVLWPWITAGDKGKVSVVWYQTDKVVDLACQTAKLSRTTKGRRLRDVRRYHTCTKKRTKHRRHHH